MAKRRKFQSALYQATQTVAQAQQAWLKATRGTNAPTFLAPTTRNLLRRIAAYQDLDPSRQTYTRVHLGFQPDRLQNEIIHDDYHQFIMAIWGRQSGKTTTAALWLYRRAERFPNTVHWYVGMTYGAARRVAWRHLLEHIPEARIASINRSSLSITLVNGSVIACVGASAPDNLRGPSLTSVVLDEYGTMKREVWTLAINPMLTATNGHAMFIGTPNALVGAHFEQMYHDIQAGRWPAAICHQRPTMDSPHIDPQRVELFRAVMRPWEFEQEFEARFVPLGGRVWPEFNDRPVTEGGHVIPVQDGQTQLPLPRGWDCICGIDFGATHQFAAVWIGVGPSNQIQILAEYSSPRQRFSVHARELRRISQPYGGPEAVRFVGDPSAPQMVAEFAPEGIHVTPANNAVYAGIERIGRLLLHHMLTLGACCPFTIRGFNQYQWNPRISGGRMKPKKEDDDEVDAARYAIMEADPPFELSVDPEGDDYREVEFCEMWEEDVTLRSNSTEGNNDDFGFI